MKTWNHIAVYLHIHKEPYVPPLSHRSTAPSWGPTWPRPPTPEITLSCRRSQRDPVWAAHGWEASACRSAFRTKYQQLVHIRPRTWSRGPGPDLYLFQQNRADCDNTSLQPCSLCFRAAGCGLIVRASTTPTGTPIPPPAATSACT